MNKYVALLLFNLIPPSGFAADAMADKTASWLLTMAEDPLSEHTVCLMVSAVKHTEDGQTSTAVTIIYNGREFIAKTQSNIDLSYPDVGLQVDHNKPQKIGHVFKNTNVVFDTNAEQIRDEFIKGLTGRLILGFWPTWPKTKSYAIEFDLHGFTKTYQALRHCQTTGELP
jgi:hypothetical protein